MSRTERGIIFKKKRLDGKQAKNRSKLYNRFQFAYVLMGPVDEKPFNLNWLNDLTKI